MKRLFKSMTSLLLCVIIIVTLGACFRKEEPQPTTVNIVTKDGSDYALIFSSDSVANDAVLANDLASKIYAASGVSLRAVPDTNVETEYEILVGNTKRQVSLQLHSEVNGMVTADAPVVWGYTYKDGKLAFTANCEDGFTIGGKDLLALVSEEGTLSVMSDLHTVKSLSAEEYREYKDSLKDEEDEERQMYIDSLIEKNNAFTDSQFNTDKLAGKLYTPMIGGGSAYTVAPYGKPSAYPQKGQHPRYLVNDEIIEKLSAVLEAGKDPTSVYYSLVKDFWSLADANEERHRFGVFPELVGQSGEIYRYDGQMLSMIEAKALAYLVTGDEAYAYEAIICAKNAMLTLHWTKDLHGDTYHGPSNVMIVVAAVYDWCYDVLSEKDKWHFIWGVAQLLAPNMESFAKYPPSKLQGVNSHTTGPQILRDWVTVSMVFADEAPDWWEYIGGAYFNLYLPVANEMFKNGWASSGTIIYGHSKAKHQAWAAYVIKTATGKNYLTEDGRDVMRFWMSHLRDGDKINFETGDGYAHPQGTGAEWDPYLVFAALYDDPSVLAQGIYLSDGLTKRIASNNHTFFSSIQMLCLVSAVDYKGESRFEGIDEIQYFEDPASQMTARESWLDKDAVSVLMKIGNLTTTDHDVYDHGTFQIYYKGLLAGTSGPYKYGSNSYFYYRKSTVASNGLLVFNPAKADEEFTGNNASRYFYSGGQLQKQVETGSVKAWLESGRMADTTGAAYGYNQDGTPRYAYLAGDLTDAYDADTVDYMGRRMFTLFTGDKDFPVLFFTFDQLLSDDEAFTKHWLLHTLKEPSIDQDSLTATVINGDGKMYLESLYGADAIVKIGGEGKAWWINGYFKDPNDKGSWNPKTQDFDDPTDKGSWVEGKENNDDPAYNGTANYENIWGRIELRTEGERYSKFFTVMAVTDTENEAKFEIEKFKTDDDTVYGAKFGNTVVAFLNSADKPSIKQYKEFSFTTEGDGSCEYYVAGIEAGTWEIFVNGVSVKTVKATKDGALLSFTAPCGNVTVKPGGDVMGANSGKIQYNTGGATMPTDAPTVYNGDVVTVLPTENIVRGNDVFVGWYTSPDLDPESAITEIPIGQSGTVRLYAKWFCNFVNEDYSKTGVDLYERNGEENYITYYGGAKTGAGFVTKTDKNGKRYLEWTEGTSDPMILQKSANRNFSTLATDDKCVSFTFSFSLDEGKPCIKTYCLIHAKQDVNGEVIDSVSVKFFNVGSDGSITTARGDHLATLTENKITNIRFVVDFKKGEIRYYNDDYNVVSVNKFTAPAATKAENTEELLKCLTEYLWYMRADSSSDIDNAALRVYGIRCQEGDEFSLQQTEGIKYHTGGGELPDDAPKTFKDGGTLLPESVEREGYSFVGWYTSPDFREDSLIRIIPDGTTGLYEVYAKWLRIVVDEDYTSTSIDFTSGKTGGISYNNTKSMLYVTVDENGNKCLKVMLDAEPGVNAEGSIAVKDNGCIRDSGESVVSYEFSLSKIQGVELPPSITMQLPFVNGGSMPTVLKTNGENGKISLSGSSVIIGEIVEGSFTTIRISIDFVNKTVTAYDKDNNVIDTVTVSAIPSLEEIDREYHLFLHIRRSHVLYPEMGDTGLLVDNIKIVEGMMFRKASDGQAEGNSIVYEMGNATLPEGAPKKYDPSSETALPTDAVRNGYIFDGWYTSKDMKEGDRVYSVPKDTEGIFIVYAKWLRVVAAEDYTNASINYTSGKTGGINYNNTKSMLYVTVDENGNKCLKVMLDAEPGVNAEGSIAVKDNGTIKDSGESVVSYEFSLSKIQGVELPPAITMQLPFVNGGSMPTVFDTSAERGKIRLKGSNVVIGEIVEGSFTTVRISIDFVNKTVTAYDKDNNVIDTVTVSAIPSLEEIDREYHLFLHIRRSHVLYPEMGDTGLLVDNIKIVEGLIFK